MNALDVETEGRYGYAPYRSANVERFVADLRTEAMPALSELFASGRSM